MRSLAGIPALVCLLQAPTSGAQQYDLRVLSFEEGLPSAGVNALCEDRDGFLWVGTDHGAARSEGLRFAPIVGSSEQQSERVSALHCDQQGRVWIGRTDGSMSFWDEGKMHPVQVGDRKNGASIKSIFSLEGSVWIATEGNGILRWSGKEMKRYGLEDGLGSMQIHALVRDHRGRLLAGSDSGLFKFADRRWQAVRIDPKLPVRAVSALFSDSLGVLVGTSMGFLELDNDLIPLGIEQRFMGTFPLAIPDPEVRAILRARNGDIWLGTPSGMIQLSRSGGLPTMKTIGEANGLGHDLVNCLMQDRSGAIWSGTAFGGAAKFTSDAFMHFTDRDGLRTSTISALHRTPDGTMWFGTAGGGLARWDGAHLELYDKGSGLTDAVITSLGEDLSGFLLVGTAANGLFRSTGERFAHVSMEPGKAAKRINAIRLDDRGRSWVGTDAGLCMDPGKGSYSRIPGVEGSINDLVISNDSLWAVTGHGLFAMNILDPSLVLRPHSALPTVSMTSVVRDGSGNLWIGTDGHGLYRHGNGRTDSIGMARGLSSDVVEQVLLDAQQNLWVGTRSGVDLLELDVLQEQLLNVRHFGAQEGFVGVECLRNACMLDLDSALWFGTVRGATRYDPRRVLEDPREPLVHFTDLRLFYDQADWTPWCSGMDRGGLPRDLELPYNKNHLTFSFTGISLAYPEMVRYRYMLQGYDPGWSPITATNRVTYSNIPPGDYTFKVMARNASGIWTEQAVEYPFTIAPPIWQRTSFRLGSATVLILMLLGFVRVRERNLRKDRERLERTVQERTKELAIEKERSDVLLRNILPVSTANELKEKGTAAARRYEHCSVLFSDFKGFSSFSSSMDSDTLVAELDHFFRLFDKLCDVHGLEKIKTIGDAYMCAAGLPEPRPDHALCAVRMGMAMLEAVDRSNAERRAKGLQTWPVRIGIHTGPVVAGVVGEKKFAYDIWGDTVNVASRMESNGEAGKLNISGPVYAQVIDHVEAVPRGPIKVKGKGELQMYFVLRLKPAFAKDEAGRIPVDGLVGRGT